MWFRLVFSINHELSTLEVSSADNVVAICLQPPGRSFAKWARNLKLKFEEKREWTWFSRIIRDFWRHTTVGLSNVFKRTKTGQAKPWSFLSKIMWSTVPKFFLIVRNMRMFARFCFTTCLVVLFDSVQQWHRWWFLVLYFQTGSMGKFRIFWETFR